MRSNIERVVGEKSDNNVDPMQIKAEWRDQFPKLGLNGLYVGDGYPLCHELPTRAFLHQGAMYRYLGSDPNPKTISDDLDDGVTRFVLDTSSDLYATLCDPDPGSGSCRYKSEVVLSSTLPCTGKECDVDTLRVIAVGATSLSTPIYFEYIQQPCVHYAFYDETHGRSIGNAYKRNGRCGDSRIPLATVPCRPVGPWITYGVEMCGQNYHGERTTVATGSQRCLDEGAGEVRSETRSEAASTAKASHYPNPSLLVAVCFLELDQIQVQR